VFEYLDGPSLRSVLSASGGTLPLSRALHVVLQACDAAGEAHELGIVHRDLKPENAMLVRRGDDADFVKVLDFGLSRGGSDSGGIETQAGAVLGTARYVSPEGARGDPVGPSGDVYSLATLLFECLAGRTPFDGDSSVGILVKQARDPAPDVREFERARSTPAPLAELLVRCLEKAPERRPTDGRAFGRALARAAAESGLGARELSPRPTLFGTHGGRLASGQRTEAFGSPDIAGAPAGLFEETRPFLHGVAAPPPRRSSNAPNRLRRVGFMAACFALGALGALGAGSQLGACGR
jgi:serine/threonine-protein kinase